MNDIEELKDSLSPDIEELEQIYESFQKEYPIERLKKLTIDEYTNTNKDSFCYTLEFGLKGLGSIKGSSSYKFGIYKYNKIPKDNKNYPHDKSYAWISKYGDTSSIAYDNILNKIISIAEAAKIFDLDKIESIDISNMFKWKIAFLYSDYKLLDIFSKEALRYLSEKYGNNNTNASFSEMYKYLLSHRKNENIFEFSSQLWNEWLLYNNKHHKQKKFWAVGASFNTEDMTEFFINENIWYDGYGVNENDDRNIKELNKIKEGDILLLKSSSTKGANHTISFTRLKAIGIVVDKENQYTLNVDWIHICEPYIDFDNISYRATIEEMRNDEMLEYAKEFINNYTKPTMNNQPYDKYINILKSNYNIILTGAPGTGKTYLAKKIAESMGCSENEIGFVQFHPSYDYTDFVEGLRPIEKDGNIGFERKDGVFKEFCKKAINHSKSEDIWNNIGEYIKSNIYIPSSAGKSEYHIDNYDNKYIYLSGTSIQGYKIPISDVKKAYESKLWEGGQKNGNDSYTAALAKYIYEKVNKIISFDNCTKNFVFIIDEINRGEISKIFGELFYSIDPGYRGEKGSVYTQYQNLVPEGDVFKKGFYVPENVYIIGTMNDIDRSVESMDFAFRRRFAFVEIKAEDTLSMLDELNDESLKEKAINRLKNLNNAISKIDGLSSAYHIGASYFLKLNNYGGNFELLWKYHIEGLLREYLRGMRNVDDKIKELKKAYDNESAPNI